MIPATVVAIVLALWAANLRHREGAPRVVRYLPIAVIVAAAAAWTASVLAYRDAMAAMTADPEHKAAILAKSIQIGMFALAGLGAALVITLAILVAAQVAVSRRTSSGSGPGPARGV